MRKMKKILNIRTALSLMSIALLSSCLKDSPYTVDFTKTKPLVELPGAANVSGSAGLFEIVGVLAKASGASPFNVPVNLAAPQPLSSALTVKLSVNAAALTAYNSANSTSYVLLPAADYSSTLSVTIPAGQNLANLVVNINTSLVDPTQQYALPLTITDGGGQQISNYNTVIFGIVVKNAYDDNYTATGYVFHPSAPRALNAVYPITTVNAVTSQCQVGDLGGDYFNFDTNGSAVSNWQAQGGTPPAPASGFMTLDNPGGVAYAPASGGGGLPGGATYNVTTYPNTYTAGTKTFLFHYGYGTGSSSQVGFTRQFYEKMVGQ